MSVSVAQRRFSKRPVFAFFYILERNCPFQLCSVRFGAAKVLRRCQYAAAFHTKKCWRCDVEAGFVVSVLSMLLSSGEKRRYAANTPFLRVNAAAFTDTVRQKVAQCPFTLPEAFPRAARVNNGRLAGGAAPFDNFLVGLGDRTVPNPLVKYAQNG